MLRLRHRPPELRNGAYRLSKVTPIETLVEQARGSSDPVVLSLLVDRCFDTLDKAGRCDAVDVARRWTVSGTQNQLAWIAVAPVLDNRGDLPDARAALRCASQVSLWHESYSEIARLLEADAPKTADPAERAALLLTIVSKAYLSLPSGHYQAINRHCKEADLSDACGGILEVMSRDAQSLMTAQVASSLATARSVLPATTVATIRQRSDALSWAAMRLDGPSSPD